MPDEPGVERRVLVLIGTMSGTADMVADSLVRTLKRQGIPARALGMEKASLELLEREQIVLICTSTYGTGDPPDNAVHFYQSFLNQQPQLPHLAYGVIALGDSVYSATFCGGGRRFDEALERAGAHRLCERLEHDCRSSIYAEDAALGWLKSFTAAIAKTRVSTD